MGVAQKLKLHYLSRMEKTNSGLPVPTAMHISIVSRSKLIPFTPPEIEK